MKNVLLFISCLIIHSPTILHGQVGHAHLSKKLTEYQIRNWTTDDGLASNTLLRLCQDKAGYLWVSSYDGLTRFDGSEFITYTKSSGLPSSQIQGMIGDSKGNLWIGTGAGLLQYRAGKFMDQEKTKDLFIQTLWIDPTEKSLLIGTRGQGLFFYDIESKSIKKIESAYDRDIIRSAIMDQRGGIWAGSEKIGLSYYSNGAWKHFTEKDGLTNQEINWLYPTTDGYLYVGTNTGLFLFDGTHFTAVPKFTDKLINCITKDPHGNLWVLTSKGFISKMLMVHLKC